VDERRFVAPAILETIQRRVKSMPLGCSPTVAVQEHLRGAIKGIYNFIGQAVGWDRRDAANKGTRVAYTCTKCGHRWAGWRKGQRCCGAWTTRAARRCSCDATREEIVSTRSVPLDERRDANENVQQDGAAGED